MELRKKICGMVWLGVLITFASEFARAECAASNAMHLISVRQDALLHARWGLMADCRHPERPSRWLLLTDDNASIEEIKFATKVQSAAVAAPMMVRAGETVRLWRQDGMASIETSGVAEQSGAAGQRIQVRLLRRGADSQDVEKHVAGVVDGVGSVEMMR